MEITIRKAEKRDLGSVLDLVKGLAESEKESKSVTATLADYEKAYDEGLIHVHVAVAAEEVIGMALYYMTFSTWRGHMLYLEDFYVKDEYRSHGVGQQLFDEYLATAKEMGCKMVKWEVLDWNKKAIKFYEKNGATIEDYWWNCKIIF